MWLWIVVNQGDASPCSMGHSVHSHSAADVDRLARDVFRQIRAQKQRHMADILAGLKSPQRNGSPQILS